MRWLLLLVILFTTTLALAEEPPKKGITSTIPCSACHSTAGWRAKDLKGETTTFDHSKTGFPLTGQHTTTTCVACHDGKRTVKRACASCHQDAHRGRLAQSCDNCHSAVSWRSTRPLEIHRMTRFQLTGMHALVDCTECHRRASEHQWTGAPIDCFACHEKEYRRTDLRPLHIGGNGQQAFPRDCSLCHRSLAWAPALFRQEVITGNSAIALRVAPANHDLRFPISFGRHRTATCDDCHASQTIPRAVRCTGCHDQVRTTAQHKGPVAMQAQACLACHPLGVRR